MTTENFSNSAQTTLTANASPGATTLSVANAALLPAAPFRVVIDQEIFYVTAKSGNNLTVTPGYEGTTESLHVTGALVTNVMTAGVISYLIGLIPTLTSQLTNNSGFLTSVPAPTASTLGGVNSGTAPTHKWLSAITIAGALIFSQPTFSDIGGTTSANYVLAGPTSGAAVAPSFRALAAADTPYAVPYTGAIGDVNLGSYSIQNNNWQISDDGSAQFAGGSISWDNSGNLTVNQSITILDSGYDAININGTGPRFSITDNRTGQTTYFINDDGYDGTTFKIFDGTYNILATNANGGVGINNTGPQAALDVYDAGGLGYDMGNFTTNNWRLDNSGNFLTTGNLISNGYVQSNSYGSFGGDVVANSFTTDNSHFWSLGQYAGGLVGIAINGTSYTLLTNASGALINPMTTLGDIIYENSTPAPARLAGNTTTTKNFLTQTGTGTVSAAPAWGTIAAGDIPTLNQNTTGSAATLTTGRTIAITGDLAYTSPSFNGSANVTAAGTLATVNSNVGSYINANITVNAKGLVTAASSATTPQTLTIGSTVSWNMALGTNALLAANQSFTLSNPTNLVTGMSGNIRIVQDSTGSRVITWGSAYKFPNGIKFTLSNAPNAIDSISWWTPDGTNVYVSGLQSFA